MNVIKKLPLFLASVHVVFTILVFAPAISSPERWGLLPIPIYYADYPLSVLLIRISSLFGTGLSAQGKLAIDCLSFLIGGSLWFYCVGQLLRISAMKLARA